MRPDVLLPPRWRHLLGSGSLSAPGLFVVLVLLGATSGLSLIFAAELGETRLTILFLGPVLISAVLIGVWAGFFAALGAVGLLNFLFAEPHYSLFVSDIQDLVTLFMFFVVAATTGLLAGSLREQRDEARANARALLILSQASDRLQGAQTTDQALGITLEALALITQGAAIIVTRKPHQGLMLTAQSPGAAALTDVDFYAAELALSRGVTEPAAAPGWNGSAYTFLPIRFDDAGAGSDGVALGYARRSPAARQERYQASAAEVLRQHCELALERLHLAGRVAAEQDRASMEALRAALLSSLSHDLRSPLAGILGSVTTLKDLGAALPPEARQELLLGIETETRRLAAYVETLLQLTRLQSGSPPQFQTISLSDAAYGAEKRLRQMWPHAQIEHQLPELPPIRADAALLEQAIFNLFDNSIRYGGGQIVIAAAQEGGRLHLTICDQGPQTQADAAAFPAPRPEPAGSGLGLRICRAIATALGGEMTTTMNGPRGRSVTLSFPLETAQTAPL